MNAASNNANRTSMRNSTPVTMAPPLPARGQPGRADDFGERLRSAASQYGAFAGVLPHLSAGLLAQRRRAATGKPPDEAARATAQRRQRRTGLARAGPAKARRHPP